MQGNNVMEILSVAAAGDVPSSYWKNIHFTAHYMFVRFYSTRISDKFKIVTVFVSHSISCQMIPTTKEL